MRLAIISDIHGNLPALEAVLADIGIRAVDATINLGDLCAGPLWPAETLALLESLNLPTVRGNHDRWMVERPRDQLPPAARFEYDALSEAQRARLHALPAIIALDHDILAVHGTPTDDSTYLTEEQHEGRLIPAGRDLVRQRLGDAVRHAVVLCGHSHRQSLTQLPDGPLILNPGTVGCPVFADLPTAQQSEPRSPHARYAILTKGPAGWSADFIALAYDWNRCAARALDVGFPRWAQAYATGAVTG